MIGPMLVGALLALITTLPLAWKWQLGVRRTIVIILALTLVSGLFTAALTLLVALDVLLRTSIIWILTIMLAFALLAFRFYRDPDRTAPDRNDVIVSPADGEIIYVREVHEGVLPISIKHGRNYSLRELTKTQLHSEEAIVIGIAMNFADVHVNRAPIAGKITLQRHFPGSFGSLRHPEMVFANERATTLIECNGLQIAVVQIASRLVRQIANFVHEGQDVTLGQRIGVIRLGSQVDLVLPMQQTLQVTVKTGERVTAGQSIVAVYGNPDST